MDTRTVGTLAGGGVGGTKTFGTGGSEDFNSGGGGFVGFETITAGAGGGGTTGGTITFGTGGCEGARSGSGGFVDFGTVTAGAGGGTTGGTKISGAGGSEGVKKTDPLHAGQGTVWPVPSDGYSIGWPQCEHSHFKYSPMFRISGSLENHSPNSNPAIDFQTNKTRRPPRGRCLEIWRRKIISRPGQSTRESNRFVRA
jgi:hypothetical protein